MRDPKQTGQSERRQGLGERLQRSLARPRVHRYGPSVRRLLNTRRRRRLPLRACVCVSAGPKLFKEPSFKSNKFIIHNALSRCCLAGKVNEAQKSKIVEVEDEDWA